MPRVPEPSDGTERKLLLGWLAFHRDALAAKCSGLSDDELTQRSALLSTLSLQGLVRHLTEVEHRYLVHALSGPTATSAAVYPGDENPTADIEFLHPGEAQDSLQRWREEQRRADALLVNGKLTDKCPGNARSVRWNLMKVIGEYARHNGHADLIRERIDGATGE